MRPSFEELFEQPFEYPDIEMRERFSDLIGLDEHKSRLTKILSLLINPDGIRSWAEKYHPDSDRIVNLVLKRPPLVVLEGDVGCGKTELAITIGDAVARQEKIGITLLPLSLATRGQGLVGEMTKLISSAFDYTIEKAAKLKSQTGSSRGGIILLVDEADALAQSREANQMHHEDKAGVNAFIRGIDRIANGKLPAAVIMCTNRLSSLDPAIKRRSADIIKFERPNETQQLAVIAEPLRELGFSPKQVEELISEANKKHTDSLGYGYSFSDLMQRVLPSIILDAYPNKPVGYEQAFNIAQSILPTPPFKD
jgi:AAA+ superfamily predicted ATPase